MSGLTVVSLFDGIGGFPLAFERAGAKTVATVEIDTAAAAISARHFPHAHQFDDVTKVTGDDLRSVGFVPERGLITAGWPCQDLSVAGRRAGLGGARSGLWWEVVRLLDELHPKWFVGENVPGLLSSNGGRDMGAVVGSLGDLGYGFAYRVLDAQHHGVPQRRRRVFFVGHFGEPWSASAEVLFELESGGGDSAPGSETGAGVAAGSERGTGVLSRSGGGVAPTLVRRYAKGTDSDATDAMLIEDSPDTHTHTRFRRCRAAGNAATGSTPNRQPGGISSWAVAALTAKQGGPDDNSAQAGHLIVQPIRQGRAESELGHEGVADTLRAGDGGSSRNQLIAITPTTILGGGVTHSLTGEGHDASEDGTGRGTPIVAEQWGGAFHMTQDPISSETHTPVLSANASIGVCLTGTVTHALTTRCAAAEEDGTGRGSPLIAPAETIVRRLTEMECERLQGFPDGWTDGQTASARYRQLGNSVAVPCVEWIARRLIAADEANP